MRLFTLTTLVFWSTFAFSQSPTERFTAWSASNPALNPYLFFNQPKYSPGDTAFFKAYLFSNQTLIKQSFILSLPVIDDRGNVVAATKLRVQNGQIHNQLVLPDSLKPGIYKFVAYAEGMIGDPLSQIFEHEFELVSEVSIRPIRPARTEVEFFPEGGSIVYDVTSKLVVKTYGDELEANGELLDKSESLITTLKIHDGVGSLMFKPDRQRAPYQVRINQAVYPLSIADDGIGVLISPGSNRTQARVILSAPPGSIHRTGALHLMLTHQGAVIFSQDVELGDREFLQYVVPLSSLSPGVATLTVFNDENQVLAERAFHVGSSMSADLTLAGNEITDRRGTITVEVKLADQSGKPQQGELAVSAIHQRLFGSQPPPDFDDRVMWAGHSVTRVDKSSSGWQNLVDLQLIAREPNTRGWNTIMNGNTARDLGIVMHFRGVALNKTSRQPVPDGTRISFYLQKDAMAYECVTKSGGFDLYTLADFHGSTDAYYLADINGAPVNDVVIEWLEPRVTFTPAPTSGTTPEKDPYATFNKKVRAINRSYSLYSKEEDSTPISPVNSNEIFEDEAGGVDVTVALADFIAFPNMDEVIREIIPALSHRMVAEKPSVRVFVTHAPIPPKADPLYIIDGLMTDNTQYFMSLNPADIINIKVIKEYEKLTPFGTLGLNGIVLVQTKQPDPTKIKAISNYVQLHGASKAVAFKQTNHADKRIPDFRSTLYWNPSIKTDKDGRAVISFKASDDVGPVEIRVVGVSSEGLPFSGTMVTVVQDNH